jgi:hypothetical protein
MPTKVSVNIHVGYPRDYADTRHATLFFEFPNYTRCAMHIIGWPGQFDFEVLDGYNPLTSRSIVSRVFAAEIPDSVSESEIRQVVAGTDVKNDTEDPYWDCKDWVYDALIRLEWSGFLTSHQRSRSIDGLIYACLEAQDEGLQLLRRQRKME